MFYEYYSLNDLSLPRNKVDSLSGSLLDVLLAFFSKNCVAVAGVRIFFLGFHVTDKAIKATY